MVLTCRFLYTFYIQIQHFYLQGCIEVFYVLLTVQQLSLGYCRILICTVIQGYDEGVDMLNCSPLIDQYKQQITSNSLTVPVHVHPSLGQTAAKASTSLRAALSGKAWVGKKKEVVVSVVSFAFSQLKSRVPGALHQLTISQDAPISFFREIQDIWSEDKMDIAVPSIVVAAKNYRAVTKFLLCWI